MVKWQRSMGRSAAVMNFGAATHLFTMLGEFPPLVVAARERGLTVVSEIYTLLSLEGRLAEERKQFPSWEPGSFDYDSVRREFPSEQILLSQTHHFLCPSDSVRDDLVTNHGIPAERTGVVPYGVHERWLELIPAPKTGRILLVGTANLRKGIHYLAMTAEKLSAQHPRLEFRVAGDVSRAVADQPVCRHLQFLGRVPRHLIQEEFRTADVFVLPSLAEGSAEVTYEALAAGLPVIATKSAGSVVRNGIEGIIVPERDPQAIADAIRELTENRDLRDRMSVAARERARDFTWERYGQRLLAYLTSVQG
jgi:glycosyltransferase involved in cell wall biosynthesis